MFSRMNDLPKHLYQHAINLYINTTFNKTNKRNEKLYLKKIKEERKKNIKKKKTLLIAL